jgi:hypothetical protein
MHVGRIIFILIISLLAGCADSEKEKLQQGIYDIAQKNERLVQIVTAQEEKIERYRTGLEEKLQNERQFMEELDVAVTCDSMPYLINACPASLKEARQKTLAEANRKGIAVLNGHKYWLGLFMSALLIIMTSFVIYWVWILMVKPTKKELAQSWQTIADEQSQLDRIRQSKEEEKRELSTWQEKNKLLKEQNQNLEADRAKSEDAAKAARQAAEAAQAETEKLQKTLSLLKAFKK